MSLELIIPILGILLSVIIVWWGYPVARDGVEVLINPPTSIKDSTTSDNFEEHFPIEKFTKGKGYFRIQGDCISYSNEEKLKKYFFELLKKEVKVEFALMDKNKYDELNKLEEDKKFFSNLILLKKDTHFLDEKTYKRRKTEHFSLISFNGEVEHLWFEAEHKKGKNPKNCTVLFYSRLWKEKIDLFSNEWSKYNIENTPLKKAS